MIRFYYNESMKLRSVILAASLLSTGFVFLYISSSTPIPSGYADSDELVTMSYFGSVAHPPGYSLLIAINHLFLSLFSPKNIAAASNLFASILQGGGLIVFFMLAHLILKRILFFSDKSSLLSSIACTIILGSSYLYWIYSTTLEVTSLTSVLTFTTIYLGLRWYLNPKHIWLLTTCLGFGILASHSQLAITLSPGFLILFLSGYKKYASSRANTLRMTILGLALIIFGFFLTSSLLLFQNKTNTPISWNFNQNLNGWINHIFRQDYAGFDPETSHSYKNSYAITPTIDSYTFSSMFEFFILLWSHFGIIGYLFAGIGLLYFWRINKLLAAVFASWFITSGPLLAAYMRNTALQFQPMLQLGITERHFLTSDLIFALLTTAGTGYLFQKILSLQNRYKQIIAYLTLITIAVLSIINNDSILTQKSGRHLASKLALTRLTAANPNSLIICTNDIDCYTLFYYHLVEQKRPDVNVIPYMPVYMDKWLKNHPEFYPYSDFDQPNYLAQLIAWNVPQRTVYLTNGINFYMEYIGLETGPFYLIPHDFLYEITTTPPPPITYQPIPNSIPTISEINNKDSYGKGIVETISTHQAYNGYLALRYGQIDDAIMYLKEAITINPNNQQAHELSSGFELFTKELSIPLIASSSTQYLNLAKQQEGEGDIEQAHQHFRFATYLDPTNNSLLTELASFYARQGYPKQAATVNKHQLLFGK